MGCSMSLFNSIANNNRNIILSNVALSLGNKELTYSELLQKTATLCDVYTEKGIHIHSKCILLISNPYMFSLCLMTLLKIEAVPMPLYAKTTSNKLNHIINSFDINFIISDHPIDANEMETVPMIEVDSFYLYALSDRIDNELKDVAMVLFTSGTTSLPKAIMLTKANIFSNILGISKYLNLKNTDRILLIKDLSHSSSIIGELLVGLYNGCTIVLSEYLPSAKIISKMISKHSISVFFAVPTILYAIIDSDYSNSEEAFSSLRIINFYGSSIHHESIAKLHSLFPQAELFYSYGQTEASPRITYISTSDILQHPGSSGKTIDQVTIDIENENHLKCKPCEIGEIVVSGPNVMKGYYLNKEKTAKTVINGKLHTGDLGYVDSDGFLYVTGRKDNMIIRAGKNIYPEEIEDVLCTHPEICSALVRLENETIVAYLVTKTKHLDKRALTDYCQKTLELYKIPQLFFMIPELPKTASGKIVRQSPEKSITTKIN